MPFASYIVSNILSIRRFKSLSKLVTGTATFRKFGLGNSKIFSVAILKLLV